MINELVFKNSLEPWAASSCLHFCQYLYLSSTCFSLGITNIRTPVTV
jgi:hypothetical protein